MAIDEKNWDCDFYEKEHKVDLNQDLEKIVIAHGFPIVDEEKYQKLLKIIYKRFSTFGDLKEKDIFMPFDSSNTGKTYGIAFIKFSNKISAQKSLSFEKMDRKHPVTVKMFKDAKENIISMPSEYVKPSIEDIEYDKLKKKAQLSDAFGREQYMVRHENETSVYQNDYLRKDVKGRDPYVSKNLSSTENNEVEQRKIIENNNISDNLVFWSPLGTFLVTIDGNDIVLYSGEQLKEYRRFSHQRVLRHMVSPMEKYLITLSANEDLEEEKYPKCICVWDIETGKLARGFRGGLGFKYRIWPILKQTSDDKYFARIEEDKISIYETPFMGLLNKKSLKINSVSGFDQSPSLDSDSHFLAYTVSERENMPAKVEILSVPSLEVVGKKSFQMVSLLELGWHEKGDFLAVKITNVTKKARTKKKRKDKGEEDQTKTIDKSEKHVEVPRIKEKSTSFEIFSVLRKGCPVNRVDLGKDESGADILDVSSFAFEPNGKHFAIIYNLYAGKYRDISIYSIGEQIREVAKLEKQMASSLFWSPTGKNLVIANLAEGTSDVTFYDSSRYIAVKRQEVIQCSGVEWSSCGRFVATFNTTKFPLSNGVNNNYTIWSYLGEKLVYFDYKILYQFRWRPRYPTLLKKGKLDFISKNLSKYIPEFRREDEAIINAALDANSRKRALQLKDYQLWVERMKQNENEERNELENLQKRYIKSFVDDFYLEEYEIEEQIFKEVVVENDVEDAVTIKNNAKKP